MAKCAAAPSCQQSHCLREPEDAPEPPLMKVWAGPLPACLVFQPWSQAPGLLGLTPAHAAVSSARWPVPTLPLDGYCNRHCNKHGRGHPQGLRSLPVPCLPLLALEPRSLPAPAVGSPSGALSETGRPPGMGSASCPPRVLVQQCRVCAPTFGSHGQGHRDFPMCPTNVESGGGGKEIASTPRAPQNQLPPPHSQGLLLCQQCLPSPPGGEVEALEVQLEPRLRLGLLTADAPPVAVVGLLVGGGWPQKQELVRTGESSGLGHVRGEVVTTTGHSWSAVWAGVPGQGHLSSDPEECLKGQDLGCSQG